VLSRRTLIVLLAGLLLIVVAVVIRIGMDDDTGDGQTTALPTPRACGTVQPNDASGEPLPAVWLDLVTDIHDAACSGDLHAVESYMGPQYEGDRALGINGGGPLTVLAQTLEQPGEVSQGGLTYCHPHDASAIFARGIVGEDAGWTAFWLHDPHDLCA
jgi:hypothetical protein